MQRDEHEYVFGTDDDELVRLGFQHHVWAEQAFAAWHRAGFTVGQTLLELGCGPGYTTVDLAPLVGPAGRVIAVDVSDRFIEHLKRRAATLGLSQIEPTLCDLDTFEPAPESIDGAYARWVLCYLGEARNIVHRVARALRPGASFAVQDYGHYAALTLAPRSPALDRVVHAVEVSIRMRGGDPDFAFHLPAMMAQAGLEVQEIRPIVRVAKPGSAVWHWPETFFQNFVPKLVEMGLLTREEKDAFEREWKASANSPNSFLFCPPVFEIIGVKPK